MPQVLMALLSVIAVAVAALALATPLHSRHTQLSSPVAPASLASAERSGYQPPFSDVSFAVFPLQPDGHDLWPPHTHPHKAIKHLHNDKAKHLTKFPNKKHLVEILPLRHKHTKKGKALAYILPKSKKSKSVGYKLIQDLSDIGFDSDDNSSYDVSIDPIASSESSNSDSLESKFQEKEGNNEELIRNQDEERVKLDRAHKHFSNNDEEIITKNKINENVDLFKEHASGEAHPSYELVDENPSHHFHYITHNKHKFKSNINDDNDLYIPEDLKKIEDILLPEDADAPSVVAASSLSSHKINSDLSSHVPFRGNFSNEEPESNYFDVINTGERLSHPMHNEYYLNLNATNHIKNNPSYHVNVDPHVIDLNTHHTPLHSSHESVANKYQLQTLDPSSEQLHSSIANTAQSFEVTQDQLDPNLGDILHILSEVGFALEHGSPHAQTTEHHLHTPIKIIEEVMEDIAQAQMSDSSNYTEWGDQESSFVSGLDKETSNDIQLQVISADNSNILESESYSNSESDEASIADRLNSIAGNAEINDDMVNLSVQKNMYDTAESSSSSSEESLEVNGDDVFEDDLIGQPYVLADCSKCKKKQKKNCNKHKSYKLTFLFNR